MLSIFKYQRDRNFWTLRYYLNLTKFQINKRFFEEKEEFGTLVNTFSIIKELARFGFSSLLIAIFIVLTMKAFEKYSLSYLNTFNIEQIRCFVLAVSEINNHLVKNEHVFETLLSVIASISGVFIGLYFTAISVVVSSVYAKVPSDVRDLLLEEKGGNVYIRSLSIISAISLILLGYMIIGGSPGILNTLLVVVLGCYGILCFVMLGIRAFFFFDPTKLSDNVFYEFNKYLKLATINGFGWNDANFQAHYQKMAARNISTLKNIIKLCCEEQYLKKQSLPIVLQKAILILCKYEKQRCLIPSDSRWYSLVPRHKNWFLSDVSAIEIALQTHTSIQPEMIPNTYWVEDELMGMIINAIKKLIQQDNIEIAYEVLSAMNTYIGKVGNDLEIKRGRKYLNELGKILDSYFNVPNSDNVQEKGRGDELALFDLYGLTGLSLAMGVFEMIREGSVPGIVAKIESNDILEDKGIYKNGLLPSTLSRIEFIRKGLKFEKCVEGELISPQWYINQLILVRYAELIKESIDELVASINECFISRANSLLLNKRFILAANHAQRGLELCHKMKGQIPQMISLMGDLKAKSVNTDLPFPIIDWDAIKSKIDGAHSQLVENIAKSISSLSQIKHENNIPDYFGQAYNIVCRECYAALLNSNAVLFNHLFPLLFYGSLSAHDKLRSETKDMNQELSLAVTFDPLKDVMELSGYALIYSELYDVPDVWGKCGEIWGEYLDSNSRAVELLGYLISRYQYHRSLFISAPRDYLRMSWQIMFNNKLRELKLISDSFLMEYSLDRNEKIKHKSPLIRAICRGGYDPHISAAEVFIINYLLKRQEAKGIEYDDVWRLSEAIEKESEDIT